MKEQEEIYASNSTIGICIMKSSDNNQVVTKKERYCKIEYANELHLFRLKEVHENEEYFRYKIKKLERTEGKTLQEIRARKMN